MTMLNICEELKNIYRNDVFPFADDITPKDLVIYFPALDLTIETDQIVDDSFELNEKLCSDTDLVFGACEASKIKFTVADVEQDLKGQWFIINQVIEGFDPIPLGKFKVDSCKKQDDLRFKDIIAYDQLKDTDINVADWYNELFPTGNETYTLKQFRESLLTYLGIEYEDEALPNDDMIVEKTIEPTQISGREALRRCVELNGAFGHINRYGRFTHKILQPAYGLYPAETLYPAEDLYPVAENDTSVAHESIIDDAVTRYKSIRFEEYTVKEIDKLQIRAEENDIGAIVGTGSNAYVIEGNFLVFGKTAAELELIARNAFGNMAKRPYRPYETDSIGLPYIEVGDTLEFALDNPVTGYVLQRTLTGIQALQDKYIAEGNEEREQNFGINNEIIQLQGKVTRIRKDVEGVSVEVEDLAQDTASRFEQTSERITQEVNDAKNELSGQIEVIAGQVVLKVDSNGNVAAVELDADPSEGTSIKLKANNIELEGLVTANGYFKILENGSVEAVNGKFSGTITGSTIISTGSSGTMVIDGAEIEGRNSNGTLVLLVTANGTINAVTVTAVDMYCNRINGYTPVHAGNIGVQSVAFATNASNAVNADYATEAGSVDIANYAQNANYASSAGTATIAYGLNAYGSGAVYVSAEGNLRPSSSGSRACGTSAGLWSSVWAVNGTIQTSDEREKTDIEPLENDERFLRFAKMVVPYIFKMKMGTSGRKHIGFIAQRIEEAMKDCGISDMEFAGLVKAPIYAKMLKDENGNDTDEYDETSEIVDYSYHLRYEEFIPLLFLWIRDLENKCIYC